MIYSFDIFDTCITRTFANPNDLFYLLAQDTDLEKSFDLAKARIKAAYYAKSKSDREDILIDEIYIKNNVLNKFSSLHKEELLELIYLRPIRSTQIFIEKIRKKKEKVIFISDIYLPSYLIRNILLKFQIAQLEDTIYLSSEIGLVKRTGNLFEYVLKQEGIKPHQLYHYGDNIYSDVVVPKKLGIKATHYKESQLNRYETSIVTQSLKPPPVRSQIAGISKAVRLEYADDITSSKNLASLAANVIAPLLTSYVAWVLEDAYQKGIKKLYFVSCDGEMLFKIAQALTKSRPAPECHYIYISRQNLLLSSITEVSQESLNWLFLEGQSKAPIDILSKLNIEPREIESVLKKYNFEQNSWTQQIQSKEIEKFWQVLQHPQVKSTIFQKVKATRKLTREYFSQEGLFSSLPWALVDLGWTLKSQRSLKKLLNQNITGYYFGILRNSLTTLEAGEYKAFLQQDVIAKPEPSQTEIMFHNHHLVKQVFTITDSPTVIGYSKSEGGTIKPFFHPMTKVKSQKIVSSLQKIVIAYAEELGKTNFLSNELEELKRCAVINAVTFLSNPKRTEVKTIVALQTASNQNEVCLKSVTCKVKVTEIFKIINQMNYPQKTIKVVPSFNWIEGSIALSNPFIRWLLFLLFHLKRYSKGHKPLWIYPLWFRIKKL